MTEPKLTEEQRRQIINGLGIDSSAGTVEIPLIRYTTQLDLGSGKLATELELSETMLALYAMENPESFNEALSMIARACRLALEGIDLNNLPGAEAMSEPR